MNGLRDRWAKAMAMAAACALHGAVLWALTGAPPVEIEGSAGAVEASLGGSFADMTAGALGAAEPGEVVEPLTPDRPAETVPPEATGRAELRTAEPAPPVSQATLPEVPQEVVEDRVFPVSHSKPPELIAPTETPVITRSLRPKTRSREIEKRAAPTRKLAETKSRSERKKPQPRGNAKQDATAGSETGKSREQRKIASAGTTRRQETGNAAASNYPGLVMKKISRVPRPRVGARGTTVVAFSISAGGGLGAISLARSSGSARLDQAALRVVRRAAPFPPPPAGARRRFSINIKGR